MSNSFVGLGKTIQTVAVLYTYLKYNRKEKILILSPSSVTEHWLREFEKLQHWHDEYFSKPFLILETEAFAVFPCNLLTADKSNKERKSVVENWKLCGGVLILSYDLFRIFSSETDFSDILSKASVVVCDEGHKIKNAETRITKSLDYIESSKKLVLTGYPLQNNLFEYYTMLNFVKPNIVGSKAEFNFKFVKPISKALRVNAPEEDVRMGRRRSWLLYSHLTPLVLRRDSCLLKTKIPPKNEYIVELKLTALQKKMYTTFLNSILDENHSLRGTMVFWAFDVLTMLLNSPTALYKYYVTRKKEFESDAHQKRQKAKQNSKEDSSSEDVETIDNQEGEVLEARQFMEQMEILNLLFRNYASDGTLDSAKLILLYDTIQHCKRNQEKLVVFSRSISTLDVIEDILSNEKEQSKIVKYVRFDGSTRHEIRQQYIDQFNSQESITVFLISTLAGGEGINLCSACKVVLFDINWNPSNDAEAAMRVWRIGQKKHVSIYRYLTCSTVEKNVYLKQLQKEQVSKWVIDNKNVSFGLQMDYKKLFKFRELEDVDITEKPIHDDILSKQLPAFGKLIYQARTQDFLLLDDPEYQINEEEKKLALGEEEYDSVYSPKRRGRRESPKKKSNQNSSTSSIAQPKQLERQQHVIEQENQAQQQLSVRLTQQHLLDIPSSSNSSSKEGPTQRKEKAREIEVESVLSEASSSARLDRLVDFPSELSDVPTNTGTIQEEKHQEHSLLEAEKQSMIHNMEKSAKFRELMKQRQNQKRMPCAPNTRRLGWQPNRTFHRTDANPQAPYAQPYSRSLESSPYASASVHNYPYQPHFYNSSFHHQDNSMNKKRNSSHISTSDTNCKKQKF